MYPFTRNKTELRELKNSIRQNGLLQPLLVYPLNNKGKYEIICGYRRAQACSQFGISKLPCIVRQLTDPEALTYMLVDNIHHIHGTLDKTAREHLVRGSQTRYYYQGSQPTQGIDILLGKRVIATAQLDEVWQSEEGKLLSRHNSYNDFVGEVILPDLPRGVLPTLHNKTGIDRNDPDWEVVT